MLTKILICICAGLGAGLGTGFAGMSAAAVISPMLITFLQVDAYTAVGIALASDVLASAVSAWLYGKHKNIDIKNGLVMMLSVLAFTVIGSVLASNIDHGTIGNTSVCMTLVLGLRFLLKPASKPKNRLIRATARQKALRSVLCGALIGLICGFIGAGGGLMMLLVLTSVLGYELKTAVGTSVFIMAATALTGAASHFIIGESPDPLMLAVCAASTLFFAWIASRIANKVSSTVLNRITGSVLTVLGLILIYFKFFL